MQVELVCHTDGLSLEETAALVERTQNVRSDVEVRSYVHGKEENWVSLRGEHAETFASFRSLCLFLRETYPHCTAKF